MSPAEVLPSQGPTPLTVEVRQPSSRKHLYSVLWNLLGAGTPMLASLFSVPILVRALGTSRFGVLTIMMPILGYASILDLGLSRALTKLIADRVAHGRSTEIAELFWTGSLLTLGCGFVFGAALAASSAWLAHRGLNIPFDMQLDALRSLYLIALGLTIAVATNACRGTLEALGRFDLSNAVRAPMGVMLAAGPLLILPFSHSVASVAAVLVAVRAMAWLALFGLCLIFVPGVKTSRPALRYLRVLSTFGGWVTLSNVLGQLLFYCDRFVVGRLLTMSAVAYLTMPQEISVQLLVIPTAVCGVFFPLFAQGFATHSASSIDNIKQSAGYVFLLVFPISLALALFAGPGLKIWLGPAFAQHSTTVMCYCAIALLFSATALVPFATIQAAHRPDIPSKVCLVETCLYVPTLWWLVKRFGIEGAALGFTLRTITETGLFWVAAHRLLPESHLIKYSLKLLSLPMIVLLVTGFAPIGVTAKAALATLAAGNWLLFFYRGCIRTRVADS